MKVPDANYNGEFTVNGCEARPLKISIVTACRNNEKTILDTIESVNTQDYEHIEHIFVDGASRDHTVSIINRACRVNHIVVSEPDKGIYDALNKGIKRATGEIIGFLHADDFFASRDTVRDIANRFNTGIGGVYGDLQYVREHDKSSVVRNWKSSVFRPALLKRGWMPPHPTLYVRREFYDLIGGFDRNFTVAADYLFILQLFNTLGFRATYLPKTLVKMRTGGQSNRSLAHIIKKSQEDLIALRLTGAGGVPTLAMKNLRKIGQFFPNNSTCG